MRLLVFGALGLAGFWLVLFAAGVGGWVRFVVALIVCVLGMTYVLSSCADVEPTRGRGLP